MLALTKFSLHFVPTKAVKGQVLVDFLVDHPRLEIEEINLIETKPWRLYFGGSKYQKGAGIEILLVSQLGEPTKFLFEIDKA